MTRLTLTLLCCLLFATTLTAQGSQPAGSGFMSIETSRAPYNSPASPWLPDWQPNPRFPLTVSLRLETRLYDGSNFIGAGSGHLFDQGANLDFRYRCDLTFPVGPAIEFQARWVTPNRKLEIRLRDPHSDRTRTCRLTTSMLQPPPPPRGAPTTP
jgi:hypothetical protein